MSKHRSSHQWIDLVPRGGHFQDVPQGHFLLGVAAGLLTVALAGCGGGGGGGSGFPGGPGASAITGGSSGGAAALAAATSVNVGITGVSINSPPVVNFTVTDQNGVGLAGITDTDLRFNIVKLMPGQNGEPSN